MLFCLRATSLLGDCRLKRKGIVCKFHKLSYICSPFLKRKCRGRVEIGRQARLRIWCREAYGFDSLRPHSKREPSLVLFFRTGECPPFHVTLLLNPPPREEDLPSAVAENRAGEGNLRFLNPSQLRLQPLLGAYRPLPMVGSGGPAASTFCESLADADAAALKHLRYARSVVNVMNRKIGTIGGVGGRYMSMNTEYPLPLYRFRSSFLK